MTNAWEGKFVTIDDLREIRGLGIAQQILFGGGAFFFSGAFWEIVRTLSEQPKFEFTPWMMTYIVSMVTGVLLGGVGVYLFLSKQRRLEYPALLPPRTKVQGYGVARS